MHGVRERVALLLNPSASPGRRSDLDLIRLVPCLKSRSPCQPPLSAPNDPPTGL